MYSVYWKTNLKDFEKKPSSNKLKIVKCLNGLYYIEALLRIVLLKDDLSFFFIP